MASLGVLVCFITYVDDTLVLFVCDLGNRVYYYFLCTYLLFTMIRFDVMWISLYDHRAHKRMSSEFGLCYLFFDRYMTID